VSDDGELERLAALARRLPKKRRLVCPRCEGPIELRDYLLHCGCCGSVMTKLAELKALP